MKKLLVILSVLFYILWRSNSPYPSPLNWDIWEHQTVINAIRRGAFALFPSQLSDTFRFDGYTTLFHILIAGIQSVLHIQNIPGFWWIAEGIFFVLTTLAMYAFVYAITKNRLVALAGGILSAGFFESAVAFTTLFLLPQTVAALIWIVGMTVVATRKTKQNKLLAAFITTLVILPFHIIVGALGAMFLFVMALDLNIPWLLVVIASYAVPTYLATHFGLAGLNAGEAQYFNQTLIQKLNLFRQWYGYLPIPFLLLGLWKGNRTLTILFAASVGLVASPFPYVLKFVVIIRYVMIAIMAIGIGKCLELIPSKTAKYFALSALTAATLVVFITNTTTWKSPVVFRGIASHVSADEQEGAKILKERYGNTPNAFLISDPATQYILEPLTGINTQGGAYMTTESRQTLVNAMQSATAEDFVYALSHIQDGLYPKQERTILFAVTSRTLTWMEQDTKTKLSIAYNVWRPNALSLDNNLMIQQWQRQFGLTEVYRNPSIVVFEIGASI